MTIAALFVDEKGPYLGRSDIDFWGKERDARKYEGPFSVIAHPPCGRWCSMARLNEKRWGAKVGDDDGCFVSALDSVKKYKGVLEHPAKSIAWSFFNLPKPEKVGWQKFSETEWVGEVWQSAYGHKATKRTWLYYNGHNEPLPFKEDRIRGSHQIGGGINTGNRLLPRLSQAETHLTPLSFCDYLISLVKNCK